MFLETNAAIALGVGVVMGVVIVLLTITFITYIGRVGNK
jgi:hypothetical protein